MIHIEDHEKQVHLLMQELSALREMAKQVENLVGIIDQFPNEKQHKSFLVAMTNLKSAVFWHSKIVEDRK